MANVLLGIGLILFVLWILGMITSFTLGGGIHILLVVGIILFIASIFTRRRSV